MAQYRINWDEVPGSSRTPPSAVQEPLEEVITDSPAGRRPGVPRAAIQTPPHSFFTPPFTEAPAQQHMPWSAVQSSSALAPNMWGPATPLRPPRPPSGPGTASHGMSPAAFEAWAVSVEDYGVICGWAPPLAASYVRLLCSGDLQQRIDARFLRQDFRQLSTSAAIDVVRSVVVGPRCEVGAWSEFFRYSQAPGDSVDAYVARCRALAAECSFQCPECYKSLTEYVLSRKVVMGLGNRSMKAEVLRCFSRLKSVSDVVNQCEIIEAADRVAGGDRPAANVAPVADARPHTDHTPPPPAPPHALETEVAAAGHQRHAGQHVTQGGQRQGRTQRRCRNCGDGSCSGNDQCPARNSTCRNCKRKGHFWRHCRSLKPSGESARSANAAMVGGVDEVADLTVRVSHRQHKTECSTTAIADTGAQVCIAGRHLLKDLGLSSRQLQPSTRPINHVAGGGLKVLGSLHCVVTAGAASTSVYVNIAEGVQHLYLSLRVCKALGLVPPDFPSPPAQIGAITTPEAPQTPTRPPAPPFELVEENVERLEKWFLEHFGRTVFSTERSPLPEMHGPPHHIHLQPGTRPHAVHVPATVPHHFYDEVRRQLDDDIAKGIIEAVPAGEATEWCARMVVVPKKSGKPRRTVDFQKLNQACLRETHHSRPPFDLVTSVPKHTFKTVADAYSGYHQIPLDDESRKLTTFITPWGRYRYCRTPMGHCSAQDAFTKRFDDVIADIPRKLKCVDDTLLHDDSVSEAFWHTYDFLQRCLDNGVTLRPDKFSFCKRNVTFAGYLLGWEEYKPSHDLIKCITDFSMPPKPSLTDIRSWFGLVNQVAPFLAVAPIMEPFRELLKKPSGKTVYWDDTLGALFTSAKETIKNLAAEGLRYYDTSRPTAVLTDYSRQGIGFLVMQQYCQCTSLEAPACCTTGWKLVLCGSRHLTAAEKNYSTLEGEALAIAWCLRKARLFLLGCKNLTFITDHKALTKIFGNKELKDINNPRILHLKERTLMFSFRIKYIKGATNCAADALSRYPALTSAPEDADEADDEAVCAAMTAAAAEATEDEVGRVVDMQQVEEDARRDEEYQLLRECVANNGWAEQKEDVHEALRPYFKMRRHLSCQGDIVLYTNDERFPRLVIPPNLRRTVLSNLHAGHQGRDSMLRRARQSVYWPGIDAEVEQKRRQCRVCEANAPSQPAEPLISSPPPQFPFQQVATDLFQLEGHTYIAYADRLSGWLEVEHIPGEATSTRLITSFRRWFTRFGIPMELSCDGGTNLTSHEARRFFSDWCVKLRISSSHYAQSNGRAEAAVKSAKRLLRGNVTRGGSVDTDGAARALLQYLNTPLHDSDASPAQLLTGRQLRDAVPVESSRYLINDRWGRTLRDRERNMTNTAARSSQRHDTRAHALGPLEPGLRVCMQNPANGRWDRSGTVLELSAPRQYLLRTDGSGRATIRNRRHLRPLTTEPQETQQGQPGAAPPAPAAPRAASPRPSRTRRPPKHLNDYVVSSRG